jgi:glyoxylase-like metal-dependent hydrolase (beta-lactamase superfamily II)
LETVVQKYAPVRVHELWPDASAHVPEGIIVLATPGHSPGSQSYYLPGQGIMFVGDAISNAPALHLPQRTGCADHAQALRSAADISAYNFDSCLFGHGEPLVGGAAVKIRALLQ